MKKSIIIVFWMAALIVVFEGAYRNSLADFSGNLDKYHFCHRCGMAIEKGDKVIVARGLGEEARYQCCPMCALMDTIEMSGGNSTIIAYDDMTGQKIEMTITNHEITKIEPGGAVLLVGGSCPKNKIFSTKDHAGQFIRETPWAEEEMLKPIPKTFAMLKNKGKAHTRCRMCTAPLEGHKKTLFSIVTTSKEKMTQCCAHCGLFTMHKLKDKAMRATTPDFTTGRLIDAKRAYYVVGNDLTPCCYPSTISFELREDAQAFQKKHGGEIFTFSETLVNIKKVMKD